MVEDNAMSEHKRMYEQTGFQKYLADRVQAGLKSVCWLVGHTWEVGEFTKGPAYSGRTRVVKCTRCSERFTELDDKS